jgi:hypothetical protein
MVYKISFFTDAAARKARVFAPCKFIQASLFALQARADPCGAHEYPSQYVIPVPYLKIKHMAHKTCQIQTL